MNAIAVLADPVAIANPCDLLVHGPSIGDLLHDVVRLAADLSRALDPTGDRSRRPFACVVLDGAARNARMRLRNDDLRVHASSLLDGARDAHDMAVIESVRQRRPEIALRAAEMLDRAETAAALAA